MRAKCRDGNSSWIPLKKLKNPNPFEVAEYATSNALVKEPAYALWFLL